MIDYEKLNVGVPNDVQIVTDDNDAEMVKIADMVSECGFEISLPEKPDDDGVFRFIIPGAMVGEFSDCMEPIDGGKLDYLIEKWNDEKLSEIN